MPGAVDDPGQRSRRHCRCTVAAPVPEPVAARHALTYSTRAALIKLPPVCSPTLTETFQPTKKKPPHGSVRGLFGGCLELVLETHHHIAWITAEVAVIEAITAVVLAIEYVVEVDRCAQVFIDIVACQQAHHGVAAFLGFGWQVFIDEVRPACHVTLPPTVRSLSCPLSL